MQTAASCAANYSTTDMPLNCCALLHRLCVPYTPPSPSTLSPTLHTQQTQLKLQQPADIEGAVALRSEEDGFWSRHISSLISALLRSGGYSPVVDEYFSQDAAWRGPQSAGGKLLLLLGDPLNQVDVPWDPDTLVQNWTLV